MNTATNTTNGLPTTETLESNIRFAYRARCTNGAIRYGVAAYWQPPGMAPANRLFMGWVLSAAGSVCTTKDKGKAVLKARRTSWWQLPTRNQLEIACAVKHHGLV